MNSKIITVWHHILWYSLPPNTVTLHVCSLSLHFSIQRICPLCSNATEMTKGLEMLAQVLGSWCLCAGVITSSWQKSQLCGIPCELVRHTMDTLSAIGRDWFHQQFTLMTNEAGGNKNKKWDQQQVGAVQILTTLCKLLKYTGFKIAYSVIHWLRMYYNLKG